MVKGQEDQGQWDNQDQWEDPVQWGRKLQWVALAQWEGQTQWEDQVLHQDLLVDLGGQLPRLQQDQLPLVRKQLCLLLVHLLGKQPQSHGVGRDKAE